MKGAMFFLRLEGKRALVVGAGGVARRKIYKLIDSGAEVTVVSKERPIFADARFKFILGEGLRYTRSNIDSYDLVVAATDNRSVNAKIARIAVEKGKLVDVATDPKLGNFFFPAVIDYGDIIIGISTGGEAPIVSKLLKKRIQKAVPREDLEKLRFVIRLRKVLRRSGISGEELERALEELEGDSPTLSDENLVSRARHILGKGE